MRKPVSRSTDGKVLAFPVPFKQINPQGPDNTPNNGPQLKSARVLDVVRDDMTRRWWDYNTSIVTIRRKLNVSIPEAEAIVRAGLKARYPRSMDTSARRFISGKAAA